MITCLAENFIGTKAGRQRMKYARWADVMMGVGEAGEVAVG